MRPTRPTAALLAGLALVAAACGGGDDDADGAAAASTASTATTAAPASTTTTTAAGPTDPAAAALSEKATCAEFLAASKPARENASRAALIIFRADAGVEREPSAEVRQEFEQAVLEVCRGRQEAGMLDAMSAVATVSQGTYLR